MKKLLILLVLAGVAYQYRAHWLPASQQGAFDEQGKPKVMVFVNDQCKGPCSQATDFLDRREVMYEQVNVSQNPAAEQTMRDWGSPGMLPMIMVGKVRLDGYQRAQVDSALAEAYGLEVLTSYGQKVMGAHFDETGKPRVVMYGVSWCGYCAKAREFFADNNVAYTELDPEKSASAKEAYQWLEGNGYPLIYVGARRIQGYPEGLLKQTLAEMF
jgi:glutaredoxin